MRPCSGETVMLRELAPHVRTRTTAHCDESRSGSKGAMALSNEQRYHAATVGKRRKTTSSAREARSLVVCVQANPLPRHAGRVQRSKLEPWRATRGHAWRSTYTFSLQF